MLLIVIICLVRYISIIIIFYSSESKDSKNISNDILIYGKSDPRKSRQHKHNN